ncbi:MAG: ABC-F family ATP-binding cassette domain-containing protein [Clostridia bacterium]|nr:ABC-F family ATP-binding cassette domain-containing protein [Clostridia bacterium]
MSVLSVRGLSLSSVERTLFSDVNFDIEKRDRVGFIGRNGTGKTSLFKIITGELSPTSGGVFVARDTTVGYMRQHACTDPYATVFDELKNVFRSLMDMETEIEKLTLQIESGVGDIDTLVSRQTALIDRFNSEGGLTYVSRTRSALLGLGFSESDFDRQVGTLSGGQASKLSLAKLLLSGADMLLLDEPTNHLDINSVRWLEGFIKDFSGSALIISHDRYFLDAVTNKTIELEHKKIIAYDGNYTLFMQKKAHELEAARRLYERDSKEIKRIEGIVEQQKRWGREHNFITARSKQKEADRIKERLQKPEDEESTIHLNFEPKRESGNDVLICNNISKSFDGVQVLSNVNLHIRKGERVFIVGANGCGKTTLFKILCGIYGAEYDKLQFGARVDVGYFDQMQSDLTPENDALSEISDSFPYMSNTEIRTALGAFLIKGDDVFKPVSALSGGERARISLLKLVLKGANFFLLDEPTNHLDTPSREALEQTLLDYAGTMLIISHDRYFINKLADRIIELTSEGVTEYLGNYDYYAEKTATDGEAVLSVSQGSENKQEKKPKVNEYKLRKEEQARERKRQNDLKKAELRIEELDAEIENLQTELQSDEVTGDYEKLMELTAELEQLQTQQSEVYELWEKLMEE